VTLDKSDLSPRTTISVDDSVTVFLSPDAGIDGLSFEFSQPGRTVTVVGLGPIGYSIGLNVSPGFEPTVDVGDSLLVPVSFSGAGTVNIVSADTTIDLSHINVLDESLSLRFPGGATRVSVPSVGMYGAAPALRAVNGGGFKILAASDAIDMAITQSLVLHPGATGEIFRGILSGRAELAPGAALGFSESVVMLPGFALAVRPPGVNDGAALTFNFYVDLSVVPDKLEIVAADRKNAVTFRVVEGSGLNCEDWKAVFVDPEGVYEPVCTSERDRTFLVARVIGDAGGGKGDPAEVDRKPLIYGLVGAAAAVVIIIVVVVILKSRKTNSPSVEMEEVIVDEREAPVIESEEEDEPEHIEPNPEEQMVFYDMGPDVCPFGSSQSVGTANRERFVNKV
jgi:hypothetical protein